MPGLQPPDLRTPALTPPLPTLGSLNATSTAGTTGSSLGGGLSGDSARTFAALLQAQMNSLVASSALGGIGGGLGGGMGGSDALFGGGASSLFGGSPSGFGGVGGLGGGMDSLMLMQTLQPLTEAITRLVDGLERIYGVGGAEAQNIDAPQSLPYRDLLNQLAQTYQVPSAFLGAVMMAESGGDPSAVGDEGKAMGLFQLHEDGMGAGLGDMRLDPELNAAIGARGLATGWHEGVRQGLDGEDLVRFAYDYRFNPGGGFAWQGDRVYSYFRFYENIANLSAASGANV